MTTSSDQLDELCINTIRTLSMDAVQKANSGHPGAPMALAPLAYALYTRVMKPQPVQPRVVGPRPLRPLGRPRVDAALLDALPHGLRLTLDDLKNFRQLGSPTAGHPEYGKYAPASRPRPARSARASRCRSGSRSPSACWPRASTRGGHDLIDHHTLRSRATATSRRAWPPRPARSPATSGLGSLIAFYDDNHIQLAGETDDVVQRGRGQALRGLRLARPGRGRGPLGRALERATREAKAVEDRPSLMIVRSHIGYGSPNKQDTTKAHGSPLGEDEVRLTKEAYGWDPTTTSWCRTRRSPTSARRRERGAELERRVGALRGLPRGRSRGGAAVLELIIEGRLPDGLDADLPASRTGERWRRARPRGR